MRNKKYIIQIIIIAIVLITKLNAINISGKISNYTFTLKNSPYYVTGDIRCEDTTTTVIEGGVRIYFCGRYDFYTNGNLKAIGNDSMPIIITRANDTGLWGAFVVDFTSKYTELQYVTISYSQPVRYFTSTYWKYGWPYLSGGFHIRSEYYNIDHCVIEHNAGCVGGGSLLMGWSYTKYSYFTNNIVRNNYSIDDGGGLTIWTKGLLIVENNLIYRNFADNGGGTFSGGGILFCGRYTELLPDTFPQTIVRHNTFVNNRVKTGYAALDFNNYLTMNDSIILINNIFYNNIGDAEIKNAKYVKSISNYLSGVQIGGKNVYDPMFINNNGNYMLSKNSPLINTANNENSNYFDRLGENRKTDNKADYGAYEFTNKMQVEIINSDNTCCNGLVEFFAYNPKLEPNKKLQIITNNKDTMEELNDTFLAKTKRNCRGLNQYIVSDEFKMQQYSKRKLIEGKNAIHYTSINKKEIKLCVNDTLKIYDTLNFIGCRAEKIDFTIDFGNTKTINYSRNISGIQSIFTTYNKVGNYKITQSSNSLCIPQNTISITVVSPQKAQITGSHSCTDSIITFSSKPNNLKLYKWNFGDTNVYTTQSTKAKPIYKFSKKNLYQIKLQYLDSNNCVDSTFVKLNIDDCKKNGVCKSFSVFIPTAFYPNGLSINKKFGIHGQSISKMEMRVYNCWGQKLYQNSGEMVTWDGSYMGKLCPSGVYVYLIIVWCKEGKFNIYEGTMHLIN